MSVRQRDYRRGKRGKAPKVSVRTWVDVRTLGKLAVLACLLRVRGNGHAGLGEACAVLLRKTFHQIVRTATDDELEAAVQLLPKAFPSTVQTWTHGRDAVRQRLVPRETPSTDNNPPDSPTVG